MKTAIEVMMEAAKPAVPPLRPLPDGDVAPATWVFAGKWASVSVFPPPTDKPQEWVHTYSDPVLVRGVHPPTKLFSLRLIYNMCLLTNLPPKALYMLDAETLHQQLQEGVLVAFKSLCPPVHTLRTLMYSDTYDGVEFRNNLAVLSEGRGTYGFKDYREFSLQRVKDAPWTPLRMLVDTEALRIVSPRTLLRAHIFPNSPKVDIATAVNTAVRYDPSILGD